MKFITDECDGCGRTTMCASGDTGVTTSIVSLCEPCVIGSDEGCCPDGYFHRASIRRGAVTENAVDHLEAWDIRNYIEDMRLRRDMVVIDIKEES